MAIKVRGTQIISKKFKSTNINIATVSKKGVVAAKKSGKCNIKVTVIYCKACKVKKPIKKVLTTKIIVKDKSQINSTPNVTETPVVSEAPSVTETPTLLVEKNADDVAALTSIINAQIALGATVSTDLDSSQYMWDETTGRLIGIDWGNNNSFNLQGRISFSELSALKKLWCDGNQLTSLDASKNTVLEELYCNENQLTALDVSDCTKLKYLDCAYNQLESLEVSKNVALAELSCFSNKMTVLDVSSNIVLEDLVVDNTVNLIGTSGRTNVFFNQTLRC